MELPSMRPGETVYDYISRLQNVLGSSYVYVLYGNDVIAPTRGHVNVEIAEKVIEHAQRIVRQMDGLNTVVAVPENVEGEITIKRMDDAYVVAFAKKRRAKGLVFEELTI